MRILGVDPGLTRCGVGVVEAGPGRRVRLVDVGVLRTAAGERPEARLLAISVALAAWFDEHRPDAVAIERVFAQVNLRTVMGTAQVAGVAMVEAARRGLPVGLHTPTEVKAAVTGFGGAEKAQVQAMVARLLDLPERPRPADAADALALAICHAWRAALPGPRRPGAEDPVPLTAAQVAWVKADTAARRRG